MEEFKKTWFRTVWMVLLLASVAMNYLVRYSAAEWVQSRPVEIFKAILDWTTIILTVVLFVVLNIEAWRTGRRYFWRKWGKWLKAVVFGCLMAAAVLGVMWLARKNGLDLTGGIRWVLYGVFYVVGLVILYLRMKYSKSKYKKD
ncbi:MAG: hypothetical protein IKU22_00460 [Alistipes sp.]|nr:hypothetical protein [Alistipes sp.]